MSAPPAGKRIRHNEAEEATAYRLQVIGAREGAIKGTLIAGSIIALCNWRFPWMRRQTLAGKAFLTMWGTVFGMVTHADHYLLQYEAEEKQKSEKWRNEARKQLASQGTVPSETSMRKWKAAYDAEAKQLREKQDAQGSVRPPASSSPVLTALEESKAGHGEESL